MGDERNDAADADVQGLLFAALERSEDREARYHIRQALQHLSK